jgi:peptide deformylase
MPIREILIWPHPILDTRSLPVGEINEDIKALADDLIDTCDIVGGVGLAAAQIGVSLQMFVLNIGMCNGSKDGYETFINPRVVNLSPGTEKVEEGCLSVPGVSIKVPRHKSISIEYTTIDGETETIKSNSLLAQALQHEMDHLDGKIMVKLGSSIKRPIIRQRMKILKRRMNTENVTYHDVIRNPE